MDLDIWLQEKNMPKYHNHSLLDIDKIAQKSGLNYLNAGYKLFVGVLALIICVASQSLIIMSIIGVSMLLITVILGKIEMNKYIHLLLIPSIFILISSIAVLIQLSRVKLGIINIPIGNMYISMTKSSLEKTFFIIVRAYSALTCLYMINLTTPMQEIIRVMGIIRIPSIIIELMYLIYRYITILLDVHNQMTVAVESRMGYHNWRNSFRSMGGIASNLLVIAFKKSSVSFDAMESRNYRGTLSFWEEEKTLHLKEFIVALIYFAFIFGIMICL